MWKWCCCKEPTAENITAAAAKPLYLPAAAAPAPDPATAAFRAPATPQQHQHLRQQQQHSLPDLNGRLAGKGLPIEFLSPVVGAGRLPRPQVVHHKAKPLQHVRDIFLIGAAAASCMHRTLWGGAPLWGTPLRGKGGPLRPRPLRVSKNGAGCRRCREPRDINVVAAAFAAGVFAAAAFDAAAALAAADCIPRLRTPLCRKCSSTATGSARIRSTSSNNSSKRLCPFNFAFLQKNSRVPQPQSDPRFPWGATL